MGRREEDLGRSVAGSYLGLAASHVSHDGDGLEVIRRQWQRSKLAHPHRRRVGGLPKHSWPERLPELFRQTPRFAKVRDRGKRA